MPKYHRFLSFIAKNQHSFVSVSVKNRAKGYTCKTGSPKLLPKMPPQWSTRLDNTSVAGIPDSHLQLARFFGG